MGILICSAWLPHHSDCSMAPKARESTRTEASNTLECQQCQMCNGCEADYKCPGCPYEVCVSCFVNYTEQQREEGKPLKCPHCRQAAWANMGGQPVTKEVLRKTKSAP